MTTMIQDRFTLFVVQSRADAMDYMPAAKSFVGLTAGDIFCVPNIQSISDHPVNSEWYGVIYDDEQIDEPLLEGLKVFVEVSDADMLILIKKHDGKYYKCPRLFRREVELRTDTLLPVKEGLEFDTVLNGYIHATVDQV